MANILSPIFPQYIDASGKPLVNGSLYTYTTGTTTTLATVRNNIDSAENKNPVTLDVFGRAPVWLEGGTYTMTLKNAAGTTVFTADNVGSSPQSSPIIYTMVDHLDMNGYSFVSTGNRNIRVTPGNSKYTNLYNPIISTSASFTTIYNNTSLTLTSLTHASVVMLKMTHTSSAVNYLSVTNSATTSPVKLEALGTDTNIDLLLLPKGAGTLNVTGTTDYENNVTANAHIPNKKKLADTYMVTNPLNLTTIASIGESALYAGGRNKNVSSVTNNGTGDFTINFTTSYSDANYYVVATRQSNTTDFPSSSATAIAFGVSSKTTSSLRIKNYTRDNTQHAYEYLTVTIVGAF